MTKITSTEKESETTRAIQIAKQKVHMPEQ